MFILFCVCILFIPRCMFNFFTLTRHFCSMLYVFFRSVLLFSPNTQWISIESCFCELSIMCVLFSLYSHFFHFFINVAAERTSLQYSRSIKQKFNELFSLFFTSSVRYFFTFLHRHHHFVKKGERETINDLFGKCIMSKVCIQNFFIFFFYHTSLFIEYFSSFFTIMVFLKLSLNIFFNIKYRMYNNSMSTICV